MARDKRISLARTAEEFAAQSPDERSIRPIVLVQVERTGADQRGQKIDGRLAIHADDVKEYLIQRLDVPEIAIAIKTSAQDDLNVEGVNLDDPECPIEWIITKSHARGMGLPVCVHSGFAKQHRQRASNDSVSGTYLAAVPRKDAF